MHEMGFSPQVEHFLLCEWSLNAPRVDCRRQFCLFDLTGRKENNAKSLVKTGIVPTRGFPLHVRADNSGARPGAPFHHFKRTW